MKTQWLTKKLLSPLFGLIMAGAGSLLHAQALPPIDKNIPAGLETATFALG